MLETVIFGEKIEYIQRRIFTRASEQPFKRGLTAQQIAVTPFFELRESSQSLKNETSASKSETHGPLQESPNSVIRRLKSYVSNAPPSLSQYILVRDVERRFI
jgi:hypothetical protein